MQLYCGKLFSIGLTGLFGTILIFWIIVPEIIQWQIKQMMRLEEGNQIFEAWSNIPVEILFKVHIFNVTNPDEIANGFNPVLQEIGPYVYEEKRTKLGIRKNLEKDTVTYQPRTMFYFRPDLSNGTEEDVITMINVPLVGVGSELNKWPKMIRFMAKYYLKSFEEKLFVQRTVKLALFEGVRVKMLEEIYALLGDYVVPLNNTFAYFIEKNRTDPYEVEVNAGAKDNKQFGKIVSWKGENQMKIWDGDSCNMINGSDGSLFPPFITKETSIYAFELDACRSFRLRYDKEYKYAGINGYRFILSKDTFTQENPNYKCFCPEKDKSKCPKSGIVSVAPCKYGAPVFLSNAHFLHADPKYLEDIKEMKPNISLHESFVVLEPNTGAILQGTKRGQVNIHLKNSASIPQFAHVPDVIMPLVWISEEADLSPKEISMIRNWLVIPLTALNIGKWILLTLSTLATVVGLIIYLLRMRSKKSVDYSYY